MAFTDSTIGPISYTDIFPTVYTIRDPFSIPDWTESSVGKWAMCAPETQCTSTYPLDNESFTGSPFVHAQSISVASAALKPAAVLRLPSVYSRSDALSFAELDQSAKSVRVARVEGKVMMKKALKVKKERLASPSQGLAPNAKSSQQFLIPNMKRRRRRRKHDIIELRKKKEVLESQLLHCQRVNLPDMQWEEEARKQSLKHKEAREENIALRQKIVEQLEVINRMYQTLFKLQ